ncbi:PREDICTED: protein MAATS1-like [Nicrophorus vespilloides]|uniref:Cilia- and flagella-associated protein 91 n=1 Tax=Nicrophorus vespilloides TaxID=110193 RepID=A0ABM1M950_NICVS|nr:PREDICTED: protein MAATS1-like [Nicrophorus vespilloides]
MSSIMKAGRPNDYMYDSAFVLSGPKDYYKHAVNSRIAQAKYAVCPIFPTMFSDMKNYPRKQYVMRRTGSIAPYTDKTHDGKTLRKSILSGTDRYKYYHNPVVSEATISTVPKLDVSCFYEIDAEKDQSQDQPKVDNTKKNVKVQTVYRATSAQTSPWEPDYTIAEGDPELLKLEFLKWGCGLPVGVHEVSLIERARMKRAWEKSMGPITDQKGFNARKGIIEEIERNQWLFREQEIQDIQNLRMELLEQMLNEIQQKSKCRNEKKMRMFCDTKLKEKQEKLSKLHKNCNREKRRLEFNYKGILSKYGHVNVFDEHADYKSELYVPLIRHGTNPKYAHQIITESIMKYKPQYYSVEVYDTMPDGLVDCPKIKNVKLPGTRLCIRETKWTTPVLKKLHMELKNLGTEEKKLISLRVRIEEKVEGLPTPEIEDYDDDVEALYQHSVFLQKVLRGRAAQISIFQGRDRCRELIEELRCNFALLKSNKKKITKKIEQTKQEQIDATRCTAKMKLLETNLKKLSSIVIGTLLDYLNKELNRLHKERACHAMALLVERERIKREAAEAGRRQQELRRRKEHDEMFKQTIKIHQETVDLYLQDIITEGMDFASKEEAKSYVDNLAHKVDEETYVNKVCFSDILEKEEYIADLMHHFVIPEVEKTIVRDRYKLKQKSHLKAAHESIYGKMETMPRYKTDQEDHTKSSTSTETETYRERLSTYKVSMAMQEVRDILSELITIPPKLEALRSLRPCAVPSIESIDDGEEGLGEEEKIE